MQNKVKLNIFFQGRYADSWDLIKSEKYVKMTIPRKQQQNTVKREY